MKTKSIVTFILSLFVISSSYAQNKLTGTVTNSKNKPVANAQIYLDVVNSGVKTDTKGNYSVDVAEDVKTINVFSYKHGLLSSEVGIENVVNFIYLNDKKNKRLNKKQKVALKYSESENKYIAVNAQEAKLDPQGISGYNTIYDMIRGRVPGVTVTGRTIRIRGASSLQSSSEPLFVIDGNPVFSLGDIVPANVKNIKVLKGPDAAIYGSRGANGVIIVTTKS